MGNRQTLDDDALLVGVMDELRAVITRLANRAMTHDEADDIRTLIACRKELRELQRRILANHPDRRTT